ncbi:MAG: hypothetical protein KDC87_13105, partial [Planctomycetes bacterium]|nr:hypothetical protein [Planctomycetota bacterium]
MRRRRALALCVVLSAVGCSASKSAVEPGRGLLSHDSNPPAGAKLWSKPTLQRGNRFTYVTAGIHQLAVQVTEVGDKGVELRGDGGAILRLSPELGEAGDGVAD